MRSNKIKKTALYCSFFMLFLFLLTFLFNQNEQQARTQTTQDRLTGHERHSIGADDAAKLTKNYRESVGHGSVLGEYFGGDAVQELLKQDGCIGLRIYFGKKDDGETALVLVGVDISGNDMNDYTILSHGFPCPPLCKPE